MATTKQKRALENTLENGGNVTQAMRQAGYSDTTAHNPSNLTSSKGYRALLHEYGLTEGLIVSALVDDIKEKKAHRLGELSLGAEILGMRRKGLTTSNQESVEDKDNHAGGLSPESAEYMNTLVYLYEKYQYARLGNQKSFTVDIPTRLAQ